MNITFKKLVTRADWEGALTDIIESARKAVAAKDADAISEANDLLNKFINASPPEKWWTTDLDDHAREALGELAMDTATATADDLAGRTEELRRIAKSVKGTVAANNEIASNIRHEKLTQALLSAMNTAKAAKELQAAVQENQGDKKVADAAQALLEAIADFKDVVTKSDPGG